MRHRSFLLILPAIIPALISSPAHGWEHVNSPAMYTLATNRILNHEIFIKAGDILIGGRANDDLFLLASPSDWFMSDSGKGRIDITGICGNDVWAVGREITMAGHVIDHARLFGPNGVIIRGAIGRSLSAYGQTVHIDTNATIGGEANLMGNDIVVEGTCIGMASLRGTRITLAGHFATNVNITAAESITVMPGTVVNGSLTYMAPGELVLGKNVTLGGRLNRNQPPPSPGITFHDILYELAMLCGAAVVGLILLRLFPAFLIQSLQQVEASHWKCLFAGMCAILILPIFGIFACFTIAGIPTGALALGSWAALVYLGKFVTALVFGRLILPRKTGAPPVKILLIGILVVFVATNLPDPLGPAIWIWVTVFGMGAMVLALLQRPPRVSGPAQPVVPGPPVA